MYDPYKGRWLEQDPTGLQAGPNPYEADSDAPTDYVDPSGMGPFTIGGGDPLLEEGTRVKAKGIGPAPQMQLIPNTGTLVQLQNPFVKFQQNGVVGTGTISVINGASIVNSAGGRLDDTVVLLFTSDIPIGPNVHWLQFSTLLSTDINGKPLPNTSDREGYYGATKYDAQGKPVSVYKKDASQTFDSGMTSNIFFDTNKHTNAFRTRYTLAFSDKPRFPLTPKGNGEQVAILDTYVVIDNKPVYRLQWQAKSVNNGNGWSAATYSNFDGGPVEKVPGFLGLPTLHGGYREKVEGDPKSDLIPIKVPNPLLKK